MRFPIFPVIFYYTVNSYPLFLGKSLKRLKDRNAPTELVQEMEEWRSSIKEESTYIASYFIDTNTDPDEEYLAFCESTKKSFKARYNEITQSLEK